MLFLPNKIDEAKRSRPIIDEMDEDTAESLVNDTFNVQLGINPMQTFTKQRATLFDETCVLMWSADV